ncbi:hypothetical protein BH09GEM1_BH09GEM1_43390 [soil metagenome]
MLLTTIAAATASAMWWANRQSKTLRGAMQAASTALKGHALATGGGGACSESVMVANAINALVERAERSSRELSQRQAYAAVGDFAAELARALAPSVASARTAIRQLENHLHIDSPFHASLTRAQRELHRLANTMQDSLRLARSGRLAARRVDLWVPLRTSLKTAMAEAVQARVRLEHPPHGQGPIWILGDHDALEQLFLNLLINGIQATEAGGTVEARVSTGDDATVTIADTGCGIPEGALDRVFEPFYTTKPERAGLGLAIAWRTAAAHGGRLSIESALGRGTVVEVALPLADAGGAYILE